MIKVKLVGHIKRAVGKEEVNLEFDKIDSLSLIRILRDMCGNIDVGFNEYNTLIIIDGRQSFIPADRKELVSGQSLTIIPFSHGG